MLTICTVLPTLERQRVEAAGNGCFVALHAESFPEAIQAARQTRVDALLISVHRCPLGDLSGVARFVREFPGIPAVALLSRRDGAAAETLLRLGATGIRAAVDCTEPEGWRRLRELVGRPASPVAAHILRTLLPAIRETTGEMRLFFDAISRLAPLLTTVQELARHLGVRPSTLMSRFYRAQLPSPKSYLVAMRLLHAAHLFRNPGLSVADVAYQLDYSSPQSFSRHLKAVLGITAGEFRRRFPFEVAAARYVDLLVTPYRETLRAFQPLTAGPWDQGPNRVVDSRPG
jgi:AraC-like DNA-binding protein